MSTNYKHNLKTLTWNIEGLFKSNLCKLDLPEIRNLINNFDVVCASEPMCLVGIKNIIVLKEIQVG